jgi:hypothetical protein
MKRPAYLSQGVSFAPVIVVAILAVLVVVHAVWRWA